MKNTTQLTPLKAAYKKNGNIHRRYHNNYSSSGNDYLDHYAKNKPSMWK